MNFKIYIFSKIYKPVEISRTIDNQFNSNNSNPIKKAIKNNKNHNKVNNKINNNNNNHLMINNSQENLNNNNNSNNSCRFISLNQNKNYLKFQIFIKFSWQSHKISI